jgi:enoyl-CoA hydratase/carnithine racemase
MLEQATFEAVKVEWPEPKLLLVTLNRPAAANASNAQMATELLTIFEWVGRHPTDVRCVVLTGAGDRAFCAGADMKERNDNSTQDWASRHRIAEHRVRAMVNCPVPIIAAVNGAAYAGGCELALCCDFIYASTTARFALTEVTLGIIPGTGGTQTLARAVGVRRAKEIILSGRPFSAQDAFAWGMVNNLCEPAELMPAALDTARKICSNAPMAVRQAKNAIQFGAEADLNTGLAFELEAYYRLIPTSDRIEGVKAFAEKRPPRFEDR